jgi:hypothetical protein
LQADGNLVITDNGAIAWVADGNQPYSRTLHPKKMREPLMFVISNSGFLYDPSRRRTWIAESTHSTDKSLWYNACMVIQMTEIWSFTISALEIHAGLVLDLFQVVPPSKGVFCNTRHTVF